MSRAMFNVFAHDAALNVYSRISETDGTKYHAMRDTEIDNDETDETPAERPWIPLATTYDVEAWIDSYNRNLQRMMEKKNATGCGICFRLAEGGEIYLHTTADGDVLLDLTPEAEWVTPLISTATRTEPPSGRIWALPGVVLTQLVLGLSSLIASARVVARHDFKIKKQY